MIENPLNTLSISILYIFIFLISLKTIYTGQKSKILLKHKLYLFFSYIMFTLCFILLQMLIEMLKVNKRLPTYIDLSNVYLFILIILIVLIWNIILSQKIKNSRLKQITPELIKESLDTLPVGVAFSDKKGRPYLVNYQIEKISRIIFGKNIINTEDFFNKIDENNLSENITILKKNPYLIIKIDNEIWQIEKISHGLINEILANNITREHQLIDQIKLNNSKISLLNKRLKSYNLKIDNHIREKELLNAKRKIHDDIGRALIFLRIYLQNPERTSNDKNELINLWKQNIVLLKGEAKNQKMVSNWEKLIEAAKSIDIDIELKGSLPKNKKVLSILTSITHESINNAILHGKAKKLFLNIDENDHNYFFKISNDGLKPNGPIVEKGGIKNIRGLVEIEGGTMKLSSNKDFILEIFLPKRSGK